MDMTKLLYPFILVAGVLQAAGVAMNGQLNKSLVNPWLAATVSFLPIVFVVLTLLAIRPLPMPSRQDVEAMPWWAPLGGIAGAVAVFGGLILVAKVGTGPFNGLLITANLLASLAIDHFGWIRMPVHRAGRARLAGAVLMVAGIALIAFR
jgi:transporter family-2 protein